MSEMRESIEIFKEPSNSSFESGSVSPEESLEEEATDQLIIKNVKITPASMHFDNAYEGKHYKQRLTIQNCGTHLAYIRLSEPNSKTFEFKSFERGINLAPGMKIVRIVRYTYKNTLGIKRGFATIWVDDEGVDYHFNVTLSCAILSLDPPLIDFGRIDAVNRATTRSFYIKNDGHKSCQFAIDLARNPLDLIVEPMRGCVPALGSVELKMEIVGSQPGEFTEEIWIKTSPPLRIVVTGIFIAPKLLVRKFINSLDFTLIDFKPTYYGSSSTQPLLIKNFSSSNSMFCVMAEIKGSTVTLEEARKIDDNYQNFIINPIDGRLAALRGAIIQITFSPVKTRNKEKNYAAGFLKVIRMDCRDVGPDDIRGHPFVASSQLTQDIITSVASTKDFIIRDDSGEVTSIVDEDLSPDSFSFETSIGVCVHGEKETAGVSLRPIKLSLNELTLEKDYHRVVLITNKSSNLPVMVKYNKVASVIVTPDQFDLKPNGSLEVLVTLKTAQLGKVCKLITFDLLGENTPEKFVIKKVGTASLKICFDTVNIVKKERLDECVECVKCGDLSAKLAPDVFPYRLDSTELAKKMQNDDFYLKYIRNLAKPPLTEDENFKDYSLTNQRLLLQRQIVCQNPDPRAKKVSSYYPYIPLPPRLLYNIKISPKSVKLRKVAAYTTITDYFTIENQNPFPIHVFLQSSKPCIEFDNNARHIIKKFETKKMTFSFSTCSIGRYFVNISVLVNASTLYEVTAVAQVVPKTLNLDTRVVEFMNSDANFKFFKLINCLNAYTSFEWEIPEGCFKLYPVKGGIKAEHFLTCMVSYTPNPSYPNVSEFVLASESGQKRVIKVRCKRRRHSVVFEPYEILVGVIALNIPIRKKLFLKNLQSYQVTFCILNKNPIHGVTIEPCEGVINGLDSQLFIITIHLNAVIEFSSRIMFVINGEEEVYISLKGVVDYPKFSFQPNIMYFRKISPYSFDTLAFKVKNLSNCDSYISFPVEEEFPEFTVTDCEDKHYPHQGKLMLQPQESKIFFLHFHPNYVSTYSLYLPYIINDIIGPAHINSNSSSTTQYFLQENNLVYEHDEDVNIIKKIPRFLPVIRVNCCAIDKILEFSCLSVKFVYFGPNHYNNFLVTDFEILNTSDEVAAVCIRIDDLHSPFSLEPKVDTSVEYHRVSYMSLLEPHERVVFKAEFSPEEMGEYEVKLPIFLRHYFDDKIFNYFTLKGVYGRPSIVPSAKRFEFEPVPMRIVNEIPVTLRMLNHFENCEVHADTNIDGLFAIFDKKSPEKGDSTLTVTLSHELHRQVCFNTTVIFYCTCDAKCEVSVDGVKENCLLTTHAFSHLLKAEFVDQESRSQKSDRSTSVYYRTKTVDLLVHKSKTCYPLFPKEGEKSDYAEYMRRLVKTVENWLFTQAFYMKCYYKIPDGFSDFCKVTAARYKMRFGGLTKSLAVELPLLQLIINIAGPGIRHELAPRPPDSDSEIDWMAYTYKTTSNILSWLRGFPVYLPHVSTKLLLNYEQYVQYEKLKHPKNTLMDAKIFYRRSKQCWLDLILQVFKTFFLGRLVVPQVPDKPISQTKFRSKQSMMSHGSEEEKEHILDLGIYGDHERELIDWLQNCYNIEKINLWAKGDVLPEDKELIFLDIDLRDSLILGAVTAHYCPYIQSEIKDMYPRPYTPEEINHNACCLVHVWKMLHFSYEISPLSIQSCGMVEMLFLVTYLYAVLPHYCPKEVLTVEAPLTQNSSTSIVLENADVYQTISYQVIFFGNESKLFSTSTDLIKIEPRAKKSVRIRYHAKMVAATNTALVFSGEVPGNKYTKAVVFTLIGVPDVSYACMEIPFEVELYKPCEVSLHLQSPFKVEAMYTVLYGQNKDRNQLYPWEVIGTLKRAKEFIVQESIKQFDGEGKCTAKMLLCLQKAITRDRWLFYTNPEIGDWGVRVIGKAKVTKDSFEHLNVIVPKNHQQLPCRCKTKISASKNCPAILFVKIPMMNNLLWNARKTMVLHNVEGEELKFWAKRIFTPTGTRILTLILNSETHPLNDNVQETIQYKVVLDKPICFVTLSKIVIDDVTSEHFYKLPIHPTQNLLAAGVCSLRLVSADGTEIRFYKLHFLSEEEYSEMG